MSNRKLTSEVTLRARTPADPLSLESLIGWLETMPPEERYDYCKGGRCLMAQYLKAAGFDVFLVWPNRWEDWEHTYHDLPVGWEGIANDSPETFGAALSRARALQGVES